MPERIDNKLWDDHQFDDNCPWKSENAISWKDMFNPKLPIIFFRIMKELYSYFPRDRRYFDEIRKFLAVKPDSPAKTIREGQQFTVSDYPRGTIIRISKDQLVRYAAGRQEEGQYDMWGFIEQERDPENNHYGDIITAFPRHHFDLVGSLPPGYIGYRNWHNSFIVGEVIHYRQQLFFFRGEQSLTKYGPVEIWKYGHTIRERVPETSPEGALQTQTRNV